MFEVNKLRVNWKQSYWIRLTDTLASLQLHGKNVVCRFLWDNLLLGKTYRCNGLDWRSKMLFYVITWECLYPCDRAFVRGTILCVTTKKSAFPIIKTKAPYASALVDIQGNLAVSINLETNMSIFRWVGLVWIKPISIHKAHLISISSRQTYKREPQHAQPNNITHRSNAQQLSLFERLRLTVSCTD